MRSNELLVRRANVGVGGSRPPMVFVHGVMHGAWCWEYYLDYFAQHGHDCYALSLRGHGGSPGRDDIDKFGLDHYVDDVAELVRTLPKPVIVGHSMGGAITQMFLAEHDDLISAAVLFASATAGGLGTLEFLTYLWRSNSRRGLVASLALLFGRQPKLAALAESPFFSGRLSGDEVASAAPLLHRESTRAVKDLLRNYTPRSDVSSPILVIGSANDALFGRRSLTRTAARYGVEPVILSELCHDMMLDPLRTVPARHIMQFLSLHGLADYDNAAFPRE